MERDELASTIAAVPGVTVTLMPDGIIVHAGDTVPALHLVADRVYEAEAGRGPAGQIAVRLVLADPEVPPRPLIAFVTDGDVAFAPDPERASAEIAPVGPSYEVVDLPPGVSYREMLRDFQTPPVAQGNLDHFYGRVLMLCAFWWGARRIGLDVDHLRPTLDDLIAELRSL